MSLLPGLWVALLGAALALALRRWYDPVPPRILAVAGLTVGALFFPVLFGGQIALPLSNLRADLPYRQLPPAEHGGVGIQGDLLHQITPWTLEVRRAWSHGRWPLWNGGSGAGMPLLADPQSQALQPLVLAAAPLPFWASLGATDALRLLVALVFLFLYLRRQGLGEGAALLGGAVYGLGGFLMLWLGWPMANAAALLPAALYAVVRCDEVGGRRDFLLLGLCGASLFLSGHPETGVYGLAATGLLLLARAWRRRSASGSGAALRLLVPAGLALGLAGVASAPVLLPVAEYLPTTGRAAVLAVSLAPRPAGELWRDLARPDVLEAWRVHTVQRLVPVFAPRAFGDETFFWGGENLIEDASGFAGTAALLLALAALLPVRGRRRFSQERWTALLLLGCLALIVQPPGFSNLAARLPAIGPTAAHQHHRLLLLVVFAVAALAACEAERWARGEGRKGIAALAAALLAGLIVWAYLAHPHPVYPEMLVPLRDRWMGTQLAALAVALTLLLVARPAGAHRLPWLLCAVAAAELLAWHAPMVPFGPRRLAWPVTPAVRFLQQGLGQEYRLLGIGSSTYPPNYGLIHGVADVRVDNPSMPAAYDRLTYRLRRKSLAPSFHRPAHPLFDLLGVRYVMTRPGVRLPFKPVWGDRSAWIWERPKPLPRLFLPERAQFFRGGAWEDWLESNPDFAARALIPRGEEGRGRKGWHARAPRDAALEILAFEPGRLRARARLPERRLLASSVLQDGHWHLFADGRPVPTLFANGPFVGAWLPPGTGAIDLVYRPRSLVAGCLLAALALAAAAAWWVPPPSRKRLERRVVSSLS
jgi:hypothetical protein